jgi:hypothetical protein
VYDPKSEEEVAANSLASRLLLPGSIVAGIIKNYAIDYKTIKHLMNQAKVSDVVVAIRLAKSGAEFGLDTPTVVWFTGTDRIKSILPKGRVVKEGVAVQLFKNASSSADRTVR